VLRTLVFAFGASAPLVLGGALGAWWRPPAQVVAVALAFAAGALLSAVSFDLFATAVEGGGGQRAALGFAAGAVVFVVVDTLLDRRVERGATGYALLAAVTLDGVPENLAMGVGLVESTSATLLVAIFASNLPEAIVGAQKMRDAGLEPKRILLIWSGTAVLLAIPVVVGYGALEGASDETLAWPLGFAAGAVLASLAATLMPEAFEESGSRPWIAYLTSLGFLLSFFVASL
jgi:zinc transporter, ZIP family